MSCGGGGGHQGASAQGSAPDLQRPPPLPRSAYVVPVPIPVALAAVAAGEGHTVGVNVQLTHWGAGRIRALGPEACGPPRAAPVPGPQVPSQRRAGASRPLRHTAQKRRRDSRRGPKQCATGTCGAAGAVVGGQGGTPTPGGPCPSGAVTHTHADQAGRQAGTGNLHLLQALLVGHEVAHCGEEPVSATPPVPPTGAQVGPGFNPLHPTPRAPPPWAPPELQPRDGSAAVHVPCSGRRATRPHILGTRQGGSPTAGGTLRAGALRGQPLPGSPCSLGLRVASALGGVEVARQRSAKCLGCPAVPLTPAGTPRSSLALGDSTPHPTSGVQQPGQPLC